MRKQPFGLRDDCADAGELALQIRARGVLVG
jgi:hypothetical protein